MITVSASVADVLTRSHTVSLAVESWRAGTLLASSVHVTDATEEGDRTLRVPERVTFTVPRTDRGVDWSPDSDEDHPLAANGQRLRVKIGVGTLNGTTEWFGRGWFLIEDAEASGDVVNVSAVGLLTLIDEARLVSPFQPTGTLVGTLRDLIEPALTVTVSSSLTDRSVPSGINFDDDRLGAVLELLDAWPADFQVTADGYLAVTPVSQSMTAVATLTDGVGGTVIQATGASTRQGGYNVVVARGTTADGGQVQGVAYDLSSARAYGGPWSPLPVPYFFASPLLTTVDQATAAAATVLARLRREAGRTFTVQMVPNPTLQLGDVVQLDTGSFSGVCAIEKLTLPYLPGGGSQTIVVRSLA